jgi:hypothetical protein
VRMHVFARRTTRRCIYARAHTDTINTIFGIGVAHAYVNVILELELNSAWDQAIPCQDPKFHAKVEFGVEYEIWRGIWRGILNLVWNLALDP